VNVICGLRLLWWQGYTSYARTFSPIRSQISAISSSLSPRSPAIASERTFSGCILRPNQRLLAVQERLDCGILLHCGFILRADHAMSALPRQAGGYRHIEITLDGDDPSTENFMMPPCGRCCSVPPLPSSDVFFIVMWQRLSPLFIMTSAVSREQL
jgi:hypothetical protein